MLCTSRKTTQFIKLYIDNLDDNSFIIVMMMMMMVMMMIMMMMTMMMVAVAAVVEVVVPNDDDDTGCKIVTSWSPIQLKINFSDQNYMASHQKVTYFQCLVNVLN